MNIDDLKPRAKVVQPIGAKKAGTIKFNPVLGERCATDSPYALAFEAVRSQLTVAGLKEASAQFEKGHIRAKFRWLWIFPFSLHIVFYSAGISTVIDGDERACRGFFKWVRRKKSARLIAQLCSAPIEPATVEAAASQHPETIRPPEHTVS